MTPEEQRIAIAEACGWRFEPWQEVGLSGTRLIKPDGSLANLCFAESWRLPDYLNDLNAMHEAEKVLTKKQQTRYKEILIWHVCESNRTVHLRLLLATAAQRAEAFLRTLELWQEQEGE